MIQPRLISHCLVLVFLLLAPLICGQAAGETAAERDPRQLRMMTFNIRYNNPGDKENAWPKRKDWLAEIVRREQPDVVGFQEVLNDQFEDLRTRLPDMTAYGVGRDDGKSRGEFVPIFYRTKRFEAVEQGTFWLSPTPDKPGSKGWDAAITRCVSWIKLRDRGSGQTFFALNTHFDHRGPTARLESAKLLLSKLRTDFAACPVILTGDFNTRTKSEPHAWLTGMAAPPEKPKPDELVFQDSYDHSAEKPTGPDSTWNGFQEIEPGQRIDFIFATPEIEVRSLAILADKRDGRFPSDHLPVVTVLRLPAP